MSEFIRMGRNDVHMDSHLLSDEFAEKIVTTARTATGDSLRSVTYITRTDFDQLYLRGDLERDADMNTFVGHEWRSYRETQNAYHNSELGEYRFTVRAFENGYLLSVATERRGVIITTDGLSMQSYEEIAEAITRMITGWDE